MRYPINIDATLDSISKMNSFLKLSVVISILLSLNFPLFSQVIFQETFTAPNGTTSGTAYGVNWSSSCPTCLAGDYWEVRSNVFEARDTNGEAEWITDNSIDISNCSFIDISFGLQSVGPMEACGTGCNSADFIRFQYNIDGTGWTDPTNSSFCSGSCAGFNVIASSNVAPTTYSTGCIPVNGSGLRLRILAQCWAADEYWRIDNVTVSCSSPDAGSNGNVNICTSASTINLFDQLGGTPNTGGTWSGPSVLSGGDLGTFNPGTMNSGTYTYSVGNAPCQATSTVIVNTTNNSAGTNGNLNICANSISPTNLFTILGGNPNIGGTWAGPSPLTGGHLGTFDPSTQLAGIYTYTVGVAPCNVSATVTVTSNPPDDASFNTTDFCEGSSNANSVSITGLAGGTFSFNPLPANGAIINPSTGLISNAVGVTSYSIQYTTNGACPQSSIETINIYERPNLQTTNYSVCIGGSVNLSVSGASNYTWDNGLGAGANHLVSPNTTTLYTVSSTNAFGCQNSSQSLVTVHPIPMVEAGLDQVSCEGTAVTLTATGATNYSWTNGISNGSPFYPTTTAIYTVTGTDVYGCTNSDSVNITIEAVPIPSFFADNLSGCAPLTSTFYNTTGGSYVNCFWTINGSILNDCNSVSSTFNTPGAYGISLSMESLNGCIGTTTYPNYISIDENPVANFSFTQVQTNSTGEEITLINQSTNASIYSWSFGDGSQSTQFEPIHAYNFSDFASYVISLTAISDNGCKDSTHLEITKTESIVYYVPNSFTPDGNEFNNTFNPIFTEGFDPFDYQLSIYNRWGELIFESRNAEIGWDGTSKGSLQANDIYTWKIDFRHSNSGERVSKTGHVNLLK